MYKYRCIRIWKSDNPLLTITYETSLKQQKRKALSSKTKRNNNDQISDFTNRCNGKILPFHYTHGKSENIINFE